MSFIATGIGLATAVYGASQQKKAQKSALSAQSSAYGQQQSLMAPYSNLGQNAASSLQALNAGNYSGFESSPDYKYSQQQMTNAVDSSAAARGSLFSGGHNVDLASRINGLASQNLGNYRSSLLQQLQGGQQAAGTMANAAGQYGQAASSNALAQGDTSSQLTGAIGGSLANLGNNLYSRYSTPQTGASMGTTYGNSGLGGSLATNQWGGFTPTNPYQWGSY